MSDYTYKAKVGQRWLRGNSLVDTEKDADTFASKTEPTQRVNQMKQDGKISKSANVEIIKECVRLNYAAILQETRSMTQDLYDFVVDNWIYDDELQDANNSAELADIIKSRIESGWGPEVTDRIISKVASFLWEDYF